VAEPYLRQKVLRLTRGKKVLELRPPVEWDKGKAVEAIWHHVAERTGSRRVLPVYCGDDVTDEDAFRALQQRGVTVRVGRKRKTTAHYYLPSPKEMVRFLIALSSLDWHTPRAR
jgi:trehalose-phosphatase